jgi:recombination protein RecA
VEKSGSWFSFEGNRIGQGRENAKLFLAQNKDVAAKIEALIRQNAGLIGQALTHGGGEDETAAAAEE